MNLAEKAEEYAINKIFARGSTSSAFIAGYRDCKKDLLDFLRANPKCTPETIKTFIEQL